MADGKHLPDCRGKGTESRHVHIFGEILSYPCPHLDENKCPPESVEQAYMPAAYGVVKPSKERQASTVCHLYYEQVGTLEMHFHPLSQPHIQDCVSRNRGQRIPMDQRYHFDYWYTSQGHQHELIVECSPGLPI